MNWYEKVQKTAMALDPEAYSYESRPARLDRDKNVVRSPWRGINIVQPQDPSAIRSKYYGVHLTPEPEIAAVYACMRATKEDPPVLIEIDDSFMKRELDVDAMVDTTLDSYIEIESKDFTTIIQQNIEDPEFCANAIRDKLDNDATFSDDSREYNDFTDAINMSKQPHPASAIQSFLESKSDEEIVQLMTQILQGNVPNELHISMVNQFRIMHPIGHQAVLGIYQIPIYDFTSGDTGLWDLDDEQLEEKGYSRQGDDIVNEKGEKVLSLEDADYDWLHMTPIYVNQQMRLEGMDQSQWVWHGTTLSRAKMAYPELLGY